MATFSNFYYNLLRNLKDGKRPVQTTLNELRNVSIANAGHDFGTISDGVKNTQQLKVDWSKFEEHTFFNSAVFKVNSAFDMIINKYPFDGTRKDIESFFTSLTGYEKYILDQFPVFKGRLIFSTALGNYIKVSDYPGALFPELAKNNTGSPILEPTGRSFSIEFHFIPPNISNDKQVICQKQDPSTNSGFSVWLTNTLSTSTVDLNFAAYRRTDNVGATVTINKGKNSHICCVLNRETDKHYAEIYVNERLEASSSYVYIQDFYADGYPLTIGSGSQFTASSTILPVDTLSGSLDEFRMFHSVRTVEQQKEFSKKSLFASDDLKLYFKFNEPPPPLLADPTSDLNAIVLDSSGNSLHSLVSNFNSSLRYDATMLSGSNPMKNERDEFCRVLYPSYADVVSLNSNFIDEAQLYDQENPNLITRLIPEHYLLLGDVTQGITDYNERLQEVYGGSGIPGNGEAPLNQELISLLFIWAKFFDEMKLFVDHFKNLKYVNYDELDTVPDQFIENLSKDIGFNIPRLFNESTLEQFLAGENIDDAGLTTSLKEVQSTIARRILTNINDIIGSKGTQHSIKALLRAVGIDPNGFIKLKEYGGSSEEDLGVAREVVQAFARSIAFTTSSLLTTPFLSASRIEPGYPGITGVFSGGTSTSINDGLLTSGSWSVEGVFSWKEGTPTTAQSLCRLETTGSNSTSGGLIASLVATSLSTTGSQLTLYVRSGDQTTSPTLRMNLNLTDSLLSEDPWFISFGRQRSDSIGSHVTSSYFLRASSPRFGEVANLYVTSSFWQEKTSGNNVFETISATDNASGSFITVGAKSYVVGTKFLNDSSLYSGIPSTTAFNGRVSTLRFWSKALTLGEWYEHVRNFESVGVEDPYVNWSYITSMSGSFERLRMNLSLKQETTDTDVNGSIRILDESGEKRHSTYTIPDPSTTILQPEIFYRSYISPRIDEPVSDDKIRVRGYNSLELIEQNPWSTAAPVYKVPIDNRAFDDLRFAIELSLAQSLDKDIVNMFKDFQVLSDIIGDPRTAYEPNYADLESLRDVYFNRLSDRINHKKLYEYYRWFDTSLSSMIYQLIPRRTRFKGINYVVESHMLERHKLRYLNNEQYFSVSRRVRPEAFLLLQMITGNVRKF